MSYKQSSSSYLPYFKCLSSIIQLTCIIMNLYNKYCKGWIISILQKVKLRFREINFFKTAQEEISKTKIQIQVCRFPKTILFLLYYWRKE